MLTARRFQDASAHANYQRQNLKWTFMKLSNCYLCEAIEGPMASFSGRALRFFEHSSARAWQKVEHAECFVKVLGQGVALAHGDVPGLLGVVEVHILPMVDSDTSASRDAA